MKRPKTKYYEYKYRDILTKVDYVIKHGSKISFVNQDGSFENSNRDFKDFKVSVRAGFLKEFDSVEKLLEARKAKEV